jgi:hypothetical protein
VCLRTHNLENRAAVCLRTHNLENRAALCLRTHNREGKLTSQPRLWSYANPRPAVSYQA